VGIKDQLGIGVESAWGTAVTPTRFLEFRDGTAFKQEIDRIESEARRAGVRVARSDDWTPGKKVVSGSIELDLTTKNAALLFKHAGFSSVVSSGSGPYSHVETPGSLTGLGLTLQFGIEDTAGTAQPFTYAGGKVKSWKMACAVGDLASLVLDLVAKSETTATALATASYTSGSNVFSFVHGAITIAGVAVKVREFELSGDNKLNDDRFFLGQDTTSEPLESKVRAYGGSLTCDFESLTAYNRFVAGTEAALVLTFTRGADVVTVAGNVRFDGETPKASNDIAEQTLPIKFLSPNTTDADAITVTVASSESAP
jgi:hypothetical protein